MKFNLKRLPDVFNLRRTEPDAALPDSTVAKVLHDIWENNRQWHMDGQEERDPQHGHMLRALLVASGTLAGVYDEDESQGDAEVKNILWQAERDQDAPGRAGTQLVLARGLMFIYQHDKDARKFLNKSANQLKKIARESEAFYQTSTSFWSDLHGCAAGRQDSRAQPCF
jgi:hypothetical protein